MASRKIEDLHPDLIPLYRDFTVALKDNWIDFVVYCTYRSNEEQEKLYWRSRKEPKGPWATNARGGESEHNFTILGRPASKAFDMMPLENGKCVGDSNHPLWKKIGDIWEKGFKHNGYWLDWYGDPNNYRKESAHFCLKKVM